MCVPQSNVKMEHVLVCVAVVVLAPGLLGDRWDQLNLHPDHLQYIMANNRDLAEECRASHTCPFKVRQGRCVVVVSKGEDNQDMMHRTSN